MAVTQKAKKELCYLQNLKTKTLAINVKGLGLDEEEYPNNLICMSRKRTYHKTIENFAVEIDNAFRNVEGLGEQYLLVLNHIVTGEVAEDSKEELVDLIDENICNNQLLIDYILNLVEENYNINIESDSNKENALQFTNAYAKRIIGASIMSRLCFPLICSFMDIYSIKKESDLFLELSARIFSYFNFDEEGQVLDLLTKIQKFVSTSVENTLYSDQVIWTYLKNLSINERTVSMDIHRNLLINIIPKLEMGRSIVSFFHVVIKKQIEYQFTANFKMSYKPITIIRTENETINPFIKIEQRLIKSVSEFSVVMIRQDINNFIKKHSNLTAKDKAYHLSNIVIHTAQTEILGYFLNKHVGRGIPVMALSKEQYIELLFIAKEWFEANNYTFIGYILLGKPQPKTSVKRNFQKGKHLLEITQSSIYRQIESRYSLMGDKIDQNVIIQFLGNLINTDFNFYELKDGKLYAPTTVPSLKQVMVEILTFIDSL